MLVYLIRHGESETNRNKKWTGWLDVPLTEKGKEDACKAGSFLRNIVFDKIYVSGLARTAQTAEIAIPECSYTVSNLFREVNVGSLADQPLSVLTEVQRERIARYGYVDFNGETKAAFRGRILQGMKELEQLPCETVAVFTHGGWICGMLETVLGTDIPRKHICCNNCTIAVFEYANEIWKLHSWINLP